MELVLNLVSTQANIYTKFAIRKTCKTCACEFVPSVFSNPVNLKHFKRVLKAFKKNRRRIRRNTWHRRLHHQDEPIILSF
jgi:hypothetical protein